MIHDVILPPVEHILKIHEDLIDTYGGAPGVRDAKGVESALSRAEHQVSYADNPSIFDIAAYVAQGISQNHPFVDGNKRVAFDTTYTILAINGYNLDVSEHKAFEVTMAMVTKEISVEEYSAWLADNSFEE